ncbi:amidohydrolase family protein [Actinomadura sp. NEAU-AAG7]|uniref:amidohydrolase family protein n=1 Tax=Actinomadura sp. NEAU-AAG7 TaxID=2839640 RepID=UPI001BE41CDA|nr:amidohydrolase family protein [Actinomadura sp. NEAU-AAG7]MBT2211073.1 amidohydrolase family protein [Actinomadura sp. NEAU-AAG7]
MELSEYRPRTRLRVEESHVPRAAVPAIDAHNHLGRWLTGDWTIPDVKSLLALMDACGVEAIVNLDGRWDAELEANLDRYDRAYPDRFLTFCHVDWTRLGRPGALAESLRKSVAAGARGLKVWKDLGLHIRDDSGRLVLPDDPRLGELWDAAADLGVPVWIHTADPIAFFDPIDERNERYEQLLAHPDWSFADEERFPRFDWLMDSLEALVAAHPRTTFVAVHAGCQAEDLGRVGRMLAAYPNLNIDIAARIAELGRQPRATRDLILRFPDRVLFGTDEFPPSADLYATHFRFLETLDEHFPHSDDDPPLMGRWRISGLGLPEDVLARVYASNAARVLGL